MRSAEVAALRAQGRTAYANATVHIDRARLIQGAEVSESVASVTKIEVRISADNIFTEESPLDKKWEWSDVFNSWSTLTLSFEVHLDGSP